MRVGGRLRRRWVWNVPLGVMKTCVFHDILGYFGISKVTFKFETSNQVKLGTSFYNHACPNLTKDIPGKPYL